jgi:ferritin
MPAERFVEQQNAQIGHEFAAHQQYVACAVYYDALTMPQMAGFSGSSTESPPTGARRLLRAADPRRIRPAPPACHQGSH